MTHVASVAVLGLGTMGRGMAANLIRAGFEVTVWNRTGGPTAEVAGARTASSIDDAVRGRDVVLYCLSDDAAVRAVALGDGGVLEHVEDSTVVVDMSTISVALSDEEHAAFAARGVAMLDAPVFGSKGEAEAGGLWVVVGGDDATVERVRPMLDAVSESVHHMGPAGSGARTKLVGNLLVAAQLQSLGEALTLAGAAGLDLHKVLDVVAVTDFRTPIYTGVGPAVLAGDYSKAFALHLMRKDVGLIGQLAGQLGVHLPATDAVARNLDAAMLAGFGNLNASALVRVIAARSGVDLTRG
ncbi:NAD(P)-dependent oxidoreductase [Cellulomonas cellasea]|uniref:NAD(P)-dependent oxidoreductase n=1 Tax=Cellulomonas cellasea TaxID=43670 RepID=UPI0025A39F7E|nr:NAD(P)-dependent oxidoreductase [Cellulomonas cellasea]MDM8086118.1 NAD(P)-dependent oxidoreductase [Cellulomonas cellasea]